MPKILAIMAKKVKEGTAFMQEALAETMGLMVYFIVNKISQMGKKNENGDVCDSRVSI